MSVEEWTVQEVGDTDLHVRPELTFQAYYPSKCSLGEGPYYSEERHELRYMVRSPL